MKRLKQYKCQRSTKEFDCHKHDKDKGKDKEKHHSDGCSCRDLLQGIAEGDTIVVYTNNPTPVTGIFENIADGKVLQLRDGNLINICCSKINYIVRL